MRPRMSGSDPRRAVAPQICRKACCCDGRRVRRDGGGAVVRRGRATAGATVVDLTHTMSADFPTFDGTPGIEMQKLKELKKDGYNLYEWRLNEHSGTHLDAPIHFSEAGIDRRANPRRDAGGAARRDQRGRQGGEGCRLPALTRDLAAWERRHGRLPDNCCVAMQSGWARHVGDKAKYVGKDAGGVMHFPGVDPDADGVAAQAAQGRGACGRHALARPRRVEGFQDACVCGWAADAGALRMSRTSTASPAVGATLVVGLAKVKGATGGPARLFALV